MKLVVVSRDGVINKVRKRSITTPGQWVPIPGSLEAMARLTRARYRIVVMTEQPQLAQGKMDMGALLRIHDKMHRRLAELGGRIEAVFFCPHALSEDCGCHAPKPGLLLDMAERFQVNVVGVPVICARPAAAEASRRVGLDPVLVRTGGAAAGAAGEIPLFDDLATAVDALLNGELPQTGAQEA